MRTDLDVPLHGVGEARPPFATLCAMFVFATVPEAVALRQGRTVLTHRDEKGLSEPCQAHRGGGAAR